MSGAAESKPLPTGWKHAKINELIDLAPKATHADDLEVGFVPMPLMGTKYGEQVAYEGRKWRDVKKGYTHFQDGDVLLAKITPCFENGKGGIARGLPSGIGAGSTEYFVCRPRLDRIVPELLHAFFKTPEFMAEGETQMTGSVGHKRVPKDFLLNSEIPIAPLAEQKRIADKLEVLLGRVDACRARIDRLPVLLKRFRQSVLAAATSGKLTEEWRSSPGDSGISAKEYLDQVLQLRRENWNNGPKGRTGRRYIEPELLDSNELPTIPESWVWASADAVSSQITDGEHIQPPYQGAGRPMLSAKHVRDGFIDADGAGLIADQAFAKALERCAPQNGDLLIVSVGATTGRVAIVENCEPFAIVRSVLLVKPIIPNRYVLRCLQSPWCFHRMTKASGASAQAHLYIKDTKRLPIPIPPLPEQQEIVRRVEELFAFADRIESRLAEARRTVERLTPATLAKAFRGELVPQDPDDEPAAVMLERMKQTSSAPSATKVRKKKSSGK